VNLVTFCTQKKRKKVQRIQFRIRKDRSRGKHKTQNINEGLKLKFFDFLGSLKIEWFSFMEEV
jgi:hypothetical protein